MDDPLNSAPSKSDHSKMLLIECGEHSLREFASGDPTDLIGQIRTVRSIADARGVELEILVYSGVSSPLSGGRPDRVSLQRADALARTLNAEGMRFCLAINGGLTLRPVLAREILEQVGLPLEALSRSGQFHGVRNSVVITHPGLLPYIRENFPDLETIASCIQPLYPFVKHDYLRAFQDYDYVVPLNQHATPGFLAQYPAYVDKMLVFLTLGCGIPQFAKCYVHFLEIESTYPTDHAAAERVKPKSLNVIPCQLTEPHRGCDDGALIVREDDLSGLLRMGVWKYKVPRNGLFRRHVFAKLLEMFDHCHPSASQSMASLPPVCSPDNGSDSMLFKGEVDSLAFILRRERDLVVSAQKE